MSRMTRETKRQAFEDLWIHPTIDRSGHWVKYLEVSIKFFKKHYNEIDKQVKKFDEEHGDKVFKNPSDGSFVSFDGIDLFSDDYQHVERAELEVIPLVLIGVCRDFESSLKELCDAAQNILGLQKKLESDKLEDFKIFLKQEGLKLDFSTNKNWQKITQFKELRNVFAHDDNPISIDNNHRFEKVKSIDKVNVLVDSHTRRVIIKNEKPVLEFISKCDKFLYEVVEQIASKIKE